MSNIINIIYTPIRFRAQTLSSAITGGFKYAKLHLIYSHTMIQAVHRQLYLFTLHKMLNSLLLCSRMAPSNGDLYVLQTESVYTVGQWSNIMQKLKLNHNGSDTFSNSALTFLTRGLSQRYFNVCGSYQGWVLPHFKVNVLQGKRKLSPLIINALQQCSKKYVLSLKICVYYTVL